MFTMPPPPPPPGKGKSLNKVTVVAKRINRCGGGGGGVKIQKVSGVLIQGDWEIHLRLRATE